MKRLLVLSAVLLAIIGCRTELKVNDYNFTARLQDSVLNDIEVGTEVSTPLIFDQKLDAPHYTVKFSYKEDLGTVLFAEREIKDGEEVELTEVKNLRVGYRSVAVGSDKIGIDIKNQMVSKSITLQVNSVAKTGVTFPVYSFYESFSPNIPVSPTGQLIINNPADKNNSYQIQYELVEGSDLQAWIVDGDEKRELKDKESVNLFEGVGTKSYTFEFLSKEPGEHKFRFVVTDKYNNRFESPEYPIAFETKGKVEFPVFNSEETYSPNKKHRTKTTLKLHNLTDKENVYKVRYVPIGEEMLEIRIVDGEQQYYNLTDKKEVTLQTKGEEAIYSFDLWSKKQGEQRFKLEVEDKYGNHFESKEYLIKFEAKANISFPRIPSETYQTNTSNYIKGGRLEIQGIDDPKNEFFATYEVINGHNNGLSVHFVVEDNQMIMLDQKEKQSVAIGTELSSYQYMIFQSRPGTTEFRIVITDKYGNTYQETYKATFQNKYYGKVELTMHRVDRVIPNLDSRSAQPRVPAYTGLLEYAKTKDVNDLKKWLANYQRVVSSLPTKEQADRYIYSLRVRVFTDSQYKHEVTDFLTKDDKVTIDITAPSEVYSLKVIHNSRYNTYSREGKLESEAVSDHSVTLPPVPVYISLPFSAKERDYLRLPETLDRVLNYHLNKKYPKAPNDVNNRTVGKYPLAIFFGEVTGVRSVGFVRNNHPDLNLSSDVDVYRQDSPTGNPYFVKKIKTNITK